MGTTAQWERILNNSYCLLLAVRKFSTALIDWLFWNRKMCRKTKLSVHNYQN